MRGKERVRVKDIAAAAGVSVATASNVLAGKRQMNSESGRRVLELAQQMGYEPHRSTAFKKTVHFVIYKKHGLVVMDTPFFSELIAGIERECSAHGYSLCISYIDRANDAESMNRLKGILADGTMPVLLLATEMRAEDVAPFRSFRAPLVLLDSLFRTESFNTVAIDNYAAGWMAGRALLDRGRRRIGLVTSAEEFNNALDRRRGLEDVLKANGLELRAEDVFAVTPTMDGAYADMRALLAERGNELPDGLFAINDLIGVGVQRALIDAWVRVPEDVALIGMDNMPICRMVMPPLETLDVPKRMLGALAVRRLVEMTEHPDGSCCKLTVSASYC